MNEKQFEELLDAAAPRYRVPPEPPLDEMWARVETAAFGAAVPARHRYPRWLALAATLLLGAGLGYAGARLGARAEAPVGPRAAVASHVAAAATSPTPFVGVAADYLQRTTALLAAVAGDAGTVGVVPGTIDRARDLLSTTRLLLDAGVPDPGLRDLLEDLELVLVQIVRLPEQRHTTDAQLITNALDERSVLPRLTLLLTDSRIAP